MIRENIYLIKEPIDLEQYTKLIIPGIFICSIPFTNVAGSSFFKNNNIQTIVNINDGTSQTVSDGIRLNEEALDTTKLSAKQHPALAEAESFRKSGIKIININVNPNFEFINSNKSIIDFNKTNKILLNCLMNEHSVIIFAHSYIISSIFVAAFMIKYLKFTLSEVIFWFYKKNIIDKNNINKNFIFQLFLLESKII
jgi:hypothetical protein